MCRGRPYRYEVVASSQLMMVGVEVPVIIPMILAAPLSRAASSQLICPSGHEACADAVRIANVREVLRNNFTCHLPYRWYGEYTIFSKIFS